MCKYSLPWRKGDIRGQVWHVLENTSVRVLSPYITVCNVFLEPVILCVIFSNNEDPLYMYIRVYLQAIRALSCPA